MQHKPLIVRQTAMAAALIAAAVDFATKGGTPPPAVIEWKPSRSLKREPTWTVTRRQKDK